MAGGFPGACFRPAGRPALHIRRHQRGHQGILATLIGREHPARESPCPFLRHPRLRVTPAVHRRAGVVSAAIPKAPAVRWPLPVRAPFLPSLFRAFPPRAFASPFQGTSWVRCNTPSSPLGCPATERRSTPPNTPGPRSPKRDARCGIAALYNFGAHENAGSLAPIASAGVRPRFMPTSSPSLEPVAVRWSEVKALLLPPKPAPSPPSVGRPTTAPRRFPPTMPKTDARKLVLVSFKTP